MAITNASEINDFVVNGYKTYIPHISIDCAILGYHDHQLKILLIRPFGLTGYCLPGGYIKRTETLTQAANRIVEERTGIRGLYLQQYKTFGDPNRIKWNEFNIDEIEQIPGYLHIRNSWLMDHTISVGFYAITDFDEVSPKLDFLSTAYEWFDIDKVPPLLFDHDDMVKDSLHAMRVQLYYYPIAQNLLPEKFTLTEIHAVYETLLGKSLDIRNFSKKLVFLGLIKKLEEKRNIGPHRAPFLYEFDKEKYEEALEMGVYLS